MLVGAAFAVPVLLGVSPVPLRLLGAILAAALGFDLFVRWAVATPARWRPWLAPVITVADVAATVAPLRDEIAAAVQAMREGARDVRGVGRIAADADAGLSTTFSGIERPADVVLETAEVSQRQSGVLAQLADAFRGVEEVSTSAAASAREATDTVRACAAAADSFGTSHARLRSLAARTRHSLGGSAGGGDAPGA